MTENAGEKAVPVQSLDLEWKEIDHEIAAHKLSLVAADMQAKVMRQKKNSGPADPALVELHVSLTEEWLERTYQAYCEVWNLQQKTKTAGFIRAVFQKALVPLIASRQGSILNEFDLHASRTQTPPNSSAKDELIRALGRLRGKWWDKLEIEAKACEHRERQSRIEAAEHPSRATGEFASSICGACLHARTGHKDGRAHCLFTTDGRLPAEMGSEPFTLCPCEQFQEPEVVQKMSTRDVAALLAGKKLVVSRNRKRDALQGQETHSGVWQDLGERFRGLAEEEERLAPHHAGDRWLRAHVVYEGQDVEWGKWHVSEGVNEEFHERFEVEATRAGIALRSVLTGEARDVWLHHVFMGLREHRSKLLFAESEKGGIILRACVASAVHCARLEKLGLESEAKNLPTLDERATSTDTKAVMQDQTVAEPNTESLRQVVNKKVRNPQTYTVLSIVEAAVYFEVAPRTVHRWRAEGKLRSGARRGSITIESVLHWAKKRSRKRRLPARIP
jgi:hypothetical protein